MTRSTRPGGWSSSRRSGPQARTLALAAAAVIAVVAAAFVILQLVGGGGRCDDYFCATDVDPAPPEGFARVTRVFEHNTAVPTPQAGTVIEVTLPLSEDVGDLRTVQFFAYSPESARWTPLASARVTDEANGVVGELGETPAMLAALRRTSAAGEVVGHLQAPGATLHPLMAESATVIHSHDFVPSGDGSLEGAARSFDDEATFQVLPLIRAAGGADEGSLASVITILETPSLRSAHVQAIVQMVGTTGVDGVGIQYLGLPPEQRVSFSLFVAELAQALHLEGKTLALVLDPPARTSAGFDEGAYDWTTLAEHADLIEIRPYLDQRTYRVVVPEMLGYLRDRVDPSRLILTVTPLATQIVGGEAPRQLRLVDAMRLATEIEVSGVAGSAVVTQSNYDVVGVNIDRDAGATGPLWDPTSATVAFSYEDADTGAGVTVYLENALSVGFKLEYIARFALGGMALDDASADPLAGNLWPGLEPFFSGGNPVLARANDTLLNPRWELVQENAGQLEQGSRGTVRWTTPATPGQYTITLTLSDGVDLFRNSLPVVVSERETATRAP